MIQSTLNLPDNLLTATELCELAHISRSSYYRWLVTGDTSVVKEQHDLDSFRLILAAFEFRGYDKGVWGIHMRLLHIGVRMNHKKIRRLMHKYGLRCPIRQPDYNKQLLREMRTNAVADNLLKREFKEHGVRAVLLTDITYIPLGQKFCYLSVILDACTMEVLSYVLSGSLKVDFVLQTVNNLLRDHGDELHTDVLLHSDYAEEKTMPKFSFVA